MSKSVTPLLVVAALAAAGCVTQAQATGTILSREVVQPVLQGPLMNGIQRAEYTVGVAGCGRRTTFVVICPDEGDGCFATGPGRFIRE